MKKYGGFEFDHFLNPGKYKSSLVHGCFYIYILFISDYGSATILPCIVPKWPGNVHIKSYTPASGRVKVI